MASLWLGFGHPESREKYNKHHCKGRLPQRLPGAVWPCKSVCTVRRYVHVCRNLNNKSVIFLTQILFIMPVLKLSRRTVYTIGSIPLDEGSVRRRGLHVCNTTFTRDIQPCSWKNSNPKSQQVIYKRLICWTERWISVEEGENVIEYACGLVSDGVQVPGEEKFWE